MKAMGWRRYIRHVGCGCLALLLCACHDHPPTHSLNACSIYSEFPHWARASLRVQRRWAVPASLQLAIIYVESHFVAVAKPKRSSWFGLPGYHKTSAIGYAQALNSTWRLYLKATHQLAADRSNFADAADFIGWYLHETRRRFGLPYSNGYGHYLAFHEGWGGYERGSYIRMKKLQKLAKRVQFLKNSYHQQLLRCGKHLGPLL